MKEVKCNKKQRILSIILSITMIITIFPIMPDNKVSAAEGEGTTYSKGGLQYTVIEGTNTVKVSGVDDKATLSEEVEIPYEIKISENGNETSY